jgi:hypothetical protein
MASPLNRPAIILNLAAFVGVGVFCVSTDAPIIQQDIKKRCQDTLLMHRISIKGLEVDGRDVILTGDLDSPLLSPSTRAALLAVNGVRVVIVHPHASTPPPAAFDNAPLPQREVQHKIDTLLENQDIAFKTDTTSLTPDSELALDKVATYLAQAPTLLCEIRGYDVPSSSAALNQHGNQNETRQSWVLALQRALAAEDYLESKGIADWRLSTRAFHVGETAEGRRTTHSLDFVVRSRE